MAEIAQELRVEPLAWCEAAALMLDQAMKSDPLAGIEVLKRMVENGAAELFGVFSGLYLVGCYVLRIDRKPRGNEAVIVAAAGRVKGASLIHSVLPHVESQFHGCKAIRVHTARPGLMRELKKHNYQVREVILVKGI